MVWLYCTDNEDTEKCAHYGSGQKCVRCPIETPEMIEKREKQWQYLREKIQEVMKENGFCATCKERDILIAMKPIFDDFELYDYKEMYVFYPKKKK